MSQHHTSKHDKDTKCRSFVRQGFTLPALTAEGWPRRKWERRLITARLQRGLQRTRQCSLISRKHATLSHRNKWTQTQVRTRMHPYTGNSECTPPPAAEIFKGGRKQHLLRAPNQLKNTNNILCYLFLYTANPWVAIVERGFEISDSWVYFPGWHKKKKIKSKDLKIALKIICACITRLDSISIPVYISYWKMC